MNALHRELIQTLPETNRHDAKSVTSFGATGYSKFIFAYPAKTKGRLQIFFLGDLADPPTEVPGMPTLKRRNNMNSDWAKITPYSVSLDRTTEVSPFVRFLINYSLGRAILKQKRQSRTLTALPEEVSKEFFKEGHATQIVVNRYERDPDARAACLKHHGDSCAACGIRMEKIYGVIALGFIHVHHVFPLARRKSDYMVDPKIDLIPLCPNCHAVTHLTDPSLSLEQLKLKIASTTKS